MCRGCELAPVWGLPAALRVLLLFQQKPKGLGIKEQIVMNKTSGGLFSSAKINELSNKYKISQILKFTFQRLVPLHRSLCGIVRVQQTS